MPQLREGRLAVTTPTPDMVAIRRKYALPPHEYLTIVTDWLEIREDFIALLAYMDELRAGLDDIKYAVGTGVDPESVRHGPPDAAYHMNKDEVIAYCDDTAASALLGREGGVMATIPADERADKLYASQLFAENAALCADNLSLVNDLEGEGYRLERLQADNEALQGWVLHWLINVGCPDCEDGLCYVDTDTDAGFYDPDPAPCPSCSAARELVKDELTRAFLAEKGTGDDD